MPNAARPENDATCASGLLATMRRRPPHAPNTLYHVTLRGNRQQPIFLDSHDRRGWERLLSHAMSRYRARLHLYCWMSNHVHMVLECTDVPIFKTMHLAAGGYARWFNAKYAHSGHLFQDRYGSRHVDTDAYLLQLIRYIHLNPVKANVVAHPLDYRWSSCRAYALDDAPSWLTTASVLDLFGNDHRAARARLQAFTTADESSIAAIADSMPVHDRRCNESRTPLTCNLDQLIALACERFGVDPTMLAGPSRCHRISMARGWVAWSAQQLAVGTLTDVANHFNRDPTTLSRCVRRYQVDYESML